ncbi:MAG: AsmA-like C-terminal region-containing protein [Planctomycetota bacterium]
MFRRLLIAVFFASFAPNLAFAQVDAAAADDENTRYWTTDWRFDNIDLRSLQQRLAWIGIEFPVAADGNADVDLKLSVPLNRLREPEAYRARGNVRLTNVSLEETEFQSVQADVELRDGIATLHRLEARQGEGVLKGKASIELTTAEQAFRVTADVKRWNLEPIATLLRQFGVGADQRIEGRLDAQVRINGKVADLGDMSTYEIDGAATMNSFRIGQSIPLSVAIESLNVSGGTANLKAMRVRSAAHPEFFADADATLRYRETVSLTASGRANDVPCSDLLSMIGPQAATWVTGKVDFIGEAQLTIVDGALRLQTDAAIASPALQILGLDCGLVEHDLAVTETSIALKARSTGGSASERVFIQRLDCDYNLEGDAFAFERLKLEAFGGELEGRLRLAKNPRDKHQIALTWRGMTPRWKASRGPNSTVTGSFDGSIRWVVPTDRLDQPYFHRGTIQASCNDLRIGPDAIGSVDLSIQSREETIAAQLRGEVFGGTVSADARAVTDPELTWRQLPSRLAIGPIKVSDLSMRELISGATSRESPYDGLVSGTVALLPGQWDHAKVDATIAGLRNRDKRIADRVAIELSAKVDRGRVNQFVVNKIEGRVADGILTGKGEWSLSAGPRTLRLRLIRADGAHVLRAVSTESDGLVEGSLGATLNVSGVGDEDHPALLISGAVDLHDGSVAGVPIGDSHSPFVASAELQSGRWKAHFPRIQSRFAHGNVAGDLSLRSAASARSGVHVDSVWRINHVDFQQLLSRYAGTNTLGRGDVSGKLQLSGRNVVSADDIRGDFRFFLTGTDATAVPGLSNVGTLLGASSLVGVRFESGEVVGSISRGDMQIKEFLMTSDRVALSGNGRLGLFDNRMDVKATLMTGDFQGQNALIGSFGRRVALQAIPVVEINRLLSNRAVVVDIRGTVQSPIVQLLPGETIRVNGGRFLTEEALGLIFANNLLNR